MFKNSATYIFDRLITIKTFFYSFPFHKTKNLNYLFGNKKNITISNFLHFFTEIFLYHLIFLNEHIVKIFLFIPVQVANRLPFLYIILKYIKDLNLY